MALETGTYISDLVITNPTSTDAKSEGDNHFRLIKSTLKATFANITGAVTKTHTQLNNMLDKTGDAMTGALSVAGNLTVTDGSSVLGYGTGAGGTVTQATNKSTDVTLNKPCGMITTHAENSPAGTTFAFFLKSTAIAETDSVIVQAVDGLALFYTMRTGAVSAAGGNGQVAIYVTNVSGAARAEAVRIRFAVIKGAQS